jgi:hypothetical protein
VDIFLSPDPRKYVRAPAGNQGFIGHDDDPLDPDKTALVFQHDLGEGHSVSVKYNLHHRYTMPSEFPRSVRFMTENPGRQGGLFTGSFNAAEVTPDSADEW